MTMAFPVVTRTRSRTASDGYRLVTMDKSVSKLVGEAVTFVLVTETL
jgi:hypothetical protein